MIEFLSRSKKLDEWKTMFCSGTYDGGAGFPTKGLIQALEPQVENSTNGAWNWCARTFKPSLTNCSMITTSNFSPEFRSFWTSGCPRVISVTVLPIQFMNRL